MNSSEVGIMLRTPEARLYRSTWSDGSIDLVAGVAVILIGLGYVWDLVIVSAFVPPLALVAWLLLRARVIEPRMGHVVMRGDRRQRTTAELLIVVIAGVLLLAASVAAVWALQAEASSASQAVDALPAVLVSLLALAGAVLTRSPRFAGYAALLVVGGLLTVILGAGPGLPLVVVGVVAAVTGVVLLGRLLAQTSGDIEDDA